MAADIITFFQLLYLFAGIFRTFITICNLPLCHTIFYLALPAMLRFSLVTFQTACTWLFMIAVFITDQAVYPTGGKHDRLYLFGHPHFQSPSPAITVGKPAISLLIMTILIYSSSFSSTLYYFTFLNNILMHFYSAALLN